MIRLCKQRYLRVMRAKRAAEQGDNRNGEGDDPQQSLF
ncbi:hypothetical protein JCM19237_4563 [Photobacterium aphoticum]|uniref:Uncharacterized protein n=1 Tax=Photobacterium aphoticum TaxID=754436 RepID=A0A090RHY9_9GAMM|nr:hypothetical protein JCM19237_4563 [Photobacterium aphoticum]